MEDFFNESYEAYDIEDFEDEVPEDESDTIEVYEDEEVDDYLRARERALYDEEEEYEEGEDFLTDSSYGRRQAQEDAWWALTDGMYGDMPTDPIEYDRMMDAMGF